MQGVRRSDCEIEWSVVVCVCVGGGVHEGGWRCCILGQGGLVGWDKKGWVKGISSGTREVPYRNINAKLRFESDRQKSGLSLRLDE